MIFEGYTILFQSTHPVRGATINCDVYDDNNTFQSTHPVRGATMPKININGITRISIHAPREGCDVTCRFFPIMFYRISIHAPREGCDASGYSSSTLVQSISIHAPREGCDLRRLKP